MREIVTAVEMKELDHNTIQKAGISVSGTYGEGGIERRLRRLYRD